MILVLQAHLNLVSTGQTPVRALTTGVVGSPTAILPFAEPIRAWSVTPIKALSAEPIGVLSAEPIRALSAELMGITGGMLPVGGSQLFASNTSAGLLVRRALHLAMAKNLKVRGHVC